MAGSSGCTDRNWRVAYQRSWLAQICVTLILAATLSAMFINYTLSRDAPSADTVVIPQVPPQPPGRKIHAKFSGDDLVRFHVGDKRMGTTNAALVRYIGNLLAGPSRLPLNLTQPDKDDYSELGQSRLVDRLLNKRRDGFYVECGAFDGETYSNTLFFEKKRAWQGLLIEANNWLYQDLLYKRRNVYSLNACLSPDNRATALKFSPAGIEGGLSAGMDPKRRESVKSNPAYKGREVEVQCFPLHSVMVALGPEHIDFFALDINGIELDVLRSIPFDELSIDVFSVAYRLYKAGTTEIDRPATLQKLTGLRDFFAGTGLYEEAGILPVADKDQDAKGQDVFFKAKSLDAEEVN